MKTALAFAVMILIAATHVSAQEGIWQTYTRANSGLIGDSISSITFDQTGTVWLAARQGVAKQVGEGWLFFNTAQYMPSDEVWDMDFTNNRVWTAHRVGITAFDGIAWTTYTIDSGLVNAPAECLTHDALGNLWIGTPRGLSKLTPDKQWTAFKHETVPAMPYNGIEALASDVQNSIWMSFIGTAGLVQFPGGNSANAKYIKQDSIPGFPKGPVYIRSLVVDRSGNLWAGTNRYGVLRMNASGATVFSRQTVPVIKNDTVHSVALDGCGNVWVGTEGGAYMYDGTTWFGFTKASGHLPHDYVYIIKADPAGHVWIGTKGGVTVFKPFPKEVTLMMPLHNMTMNTDSVLCKWEWSCPSVSAYWFEIADNEFFTNSTVDTVSSSLMEAGMKLNTGLQNNSTHYWRVRAKNDAGWGQFSPTWIFHVSFPSGVSMGDMMQPRCVLMQNYPNPCSDRTTIGFLLPKQEDVTLTIYDVLGRECRVMHRSSMGPGTCSMSVDMSTLPGNAMYFYCLRAGNEILQRPMHVVR